MVAIEAMAAGVPVMVSKGVGIGALVLEYNSGVVVDTEKDDVANCWARLLRDPIRLGEMGRAGRLLVADKFSSEVVGKQMCNLFREIIASRRLLPHR
jgi:glycosyltransferase involved in cell wall biosynthesis